jgi:hypothetical protein
MTHVTQPPPLRAAPRAAAPRLRRIKDRGGRARYTAYFVHSHQGESTMPPTSRATPPPAAERTTQQPGVDPAALNGMLVPSRHMAELANTMGTEVLRFASRRLPAQAEHFDALTRCTSMQYILEGQMEFLRRAGSEYTDELGAVMRRAQSQADADAPKDRAAN